MSKSEIWFRLDQAADIAVRHPRDRRYFLGALCKRADGVWVAGVNGRSVYPELGGHAEIRLLKKVDRAEEIYVARVLKGGLDGRGKSAGRERKKSYGLAKPCEGCEIRLMQRGVKRVYYTINDDEYGMMEIN